MAKPEWTNNAMTVGKLKEILADEKDDLIVAFPIDAEGNEYKYVDGTTFGFLREVGGEFELVDAVEAHTDPDEENVRVIFLEPYN